MIMYKKYIYLLLLVVGFAGCSIQKQQIIQIKYGLKKISPRFYLNQSKYDNARKLLLKEIESFALGSDTIIIYETSVSVSASYTCVLYESNTGKIKRYGYVCDYTKRPITCSLKEEKVSELMIINMQSIQADINSYIEKIRSSRKTPSTTHMITFATKVNGKYIFQYFSASD